MIGVGEQFIAVRVNTGKDVPVDGQFLHVMNEEAVKQHGFRVLRICICGILPVELAHVGICQHGIDAFRCSFIVYIIVDAFHPEILVVFLCEFREELDVCAVQLRQQGIIGYREINIDYIDAFCGDIFQLINALASECRIFRTVQCKSDFISTPDIGNVPQADIRSVVSS